MQPLSVAKILPGILFLLLATFAPSLPCVAVTIEEIYDDDAGEGFLDGTDLTQAEKDFLATRGNNAETRGEARKNAFEHATSILESRLTNTNTIRISAKFVIFDGQEDSNDPDRCGTLTSRTYTIATTGPRGYGYPGGRFDEGDANNPGLGTAYPYALFEALSGQEFNEQKADLSIRFSKCIPFYYGFTESVPANQIDFIQISLHEAMHGLGFLEYVEDDGSFPLIVINITETLNGIIIDQRQATIRSRTTYDEQLYSETDDDLFIDLTNSERAAAIISEAPAFSGKEPTAGETPAVTGSGWPNSKQVPPSLRTVSLGSTPLPLTTPAEAFRIFTRTRGISWKPSTPLRGTWTLP